MIRVLLVDDHALIRQAFHALLELDDDMQVVGEASDRQEGVDLAQRLEPDVVVMDLAMPRLDGALATEQIRQRGLKSRIVIVSLDSEAPWVRRVLRSGATGFVSKLSVSEHLVSAIRSASHREIYLCPEALRAVGTGVA